MADVRTPSAIGMSISNTTPAVDKHHKAKPEKPDEEKYKTDLAKAEKEHAATQERLVCLLNVTPPVRISSSQTSVADLPDPLHYVQYTDICFIYRTLSKPNSMSPNPPAKIPQRPRSNRSSEPNLHQYGSSSLVSKLRGAVYKTRSMRSMLN